MGFTYLFLYDFSLPQTIFLCCWAEKKVEVCGIYGTEAGVRVISGEVVQNILIMNYYVNCYTHFCTL